MAENKKITIVTHSGGFHCDDIFAVASLLVLLEGKDVSIVRSRDTSVIENADYVVDVGGLYDSVKKRFDHHQIGGAGVRENKIPYASFGLVWKEYGEVLSGNSKTSEKIDKMIVQPIDAHDNGIQFMNTTIPGLHPFDIGLINYIFSPTWKEESTNVDEVFTGLVSYAKKIIERAIISLRASVEGEQYVEESYKNAQDKRYIEVNQNHPWEEVLLRHPEPLFAIYKRNDGNWSMKRVPQNSFSYEPRKKLPESWAGKSGDELDKLTGVAGTVFCHNGRFIAVAKTKEAILKLAEIAING